MTTNSIPSASLAARITLISGTNRSGSATRKVTAQLQKVYADLGQYAEVIDLADLPAEVFTPAAYARKPDNLTRFVRTVVESDGLHIVTPEYNGGAPGVLKYFIDLLPFPESFAGRPVCFTGIAAGRWGGLRPVEQLQAVLSYCRALLFPERVFLSDIRQDTDAESIADQAARERLRQQAAGFVAFARRMSPRVLARTAEAAVKVA